MFNKYHRTLSQVGLTLFFGGAVLFSPANIAWADDSSKLETRCGWFDNPSPGNADLTDATGSWLIAQQGEYTAKGAWPKFPSERWVHTGVGSYGYGCLCIRGRFDSSSQRVIIIEKAFSKPLQVCRLDKRITSLEPYNPLK